MVPKQCPLLRSTFWYLICCATCFGSRDNSKYHLGRKLTFAVDAPLNPNKQTNQIPYIPTFTYPHTHLTSHPQTYITEIGFLSIVWHRSIDSGFAPSALSIRLNSMPFAVFANCPSSELRVGCCQYSRAFLLWALLILAVSRAARWLEVTPRWYAA